MSLSVALMNPRKKKGGRKNPKRVAAGKKAAKARAAKKAARSNAAKKASRKRKASKKSRSHGGALSLKVGNKVRNLEKGTRVLFSRKPKIKKVAKKKSQRLTAFQKNNLKSGGVVELSKGKKTISGRSYMNPRRRKHIKRRHHVRKNPQFNLKKIAQMAGGVAASIVVHKYGVAQLGNILAKLPVVGQYAEKINTNKWVNMATKAAIAGIAYKAGQKSKNEIVRNASKSYAATALALVVLQGLGIDSKLMLSQSGMGEELEGIEMNGIEMNGVEMDGLEMEGIEMAGDELGYADEGVSGEYVY